MPASTTSGRVRIGLSGWNYKGWRGKFYPEKFRTEKSSPTPPRSFPPSRSTAPSIRLQRPSSFLTWKEQTPADFVYFDNDAKVFAPVDAQNLIARVDALLQSQPQPV